MPWLSWNSLRVIACRVVKITTFQSTRESIASDFSPVKNYAKVDRFKYFIVFSYLQKHQPYDLEGFLRLKICKSPTLVSLHFSSSLGGCFWIVRKSEPNRLLKTLRSLSVYMLKSFFTIETTASKCSKLKWNDVLQASLFQAPGCTGHKISRSKYHHVIRKDKINTYFKRVHNYSRTQVPLCCPMKLLKS